MKHTTKKKEVKADSGPGYLVVEIGLCKTADGHRFVTIQTDFDKGTLLTRRAKALSYCYDRLAGNIGKDDDTLPIVDEDEYNIYCYLCTRKGTAQIFHNKVLLKPIYFLQSLGGLADEAEYLIDLLD